MSSEAQVCDTLLLGEVASEGIVSLVKASGSFYVQKMLASSASNWDTIIQIWRRDQPGKVIGKLNEKFLFLCTLEEYKPRIETILQLLAQTPHILFVFDTVFKGDYECLIPDDYTAWAGHRGECLLHWWLRTEDLPSSPQLVDERAALMRAMLKRLLDQQANIVQFKTRAEYIVAAQGFLQDQDRGVLLRLYVPTARLWSSELRRLLDLFRDYLSKVSKHPVTLQQTKTDTGVTYTFAATDSSLTSDALRDQLGHFTAFVDLCVKDPATAERLLERVMETKDSHLFVERYSREARRILLDMEYERKQRLLSLEHRIHSELADVAEVASNPNFFRGLAERILPPVQRIGEAFSEPRTISASGSERQTGATIQIAHAQFVQTVNGIVAKEILGNATVTTDEHDLAALFTEFARTEQELGELRSALAELKDTQLPATVRTSAKQRILTFLGRVSSEVGRRSLDVLQKYVEGLLLGTNGN